MFVYEKKLQYPVRIKNTNPKLAALIISQYGGPNNNRLLYSGVCNAHFLYTNRKIPSPVLCCSCRFRIPPSFCIAYPKPCRREAAGLHPYLKNKAEGSRPRPCFIS